MMSTTDNGPVTDEVVRSYLTLDPALYSIWMQGDITTALILSTSLDPVETFDELIESDDVNQACAAYLIRMGAPVFKDVKTQDAYVDALENDLRRGIPPAEARDAALRSVGSGSSSVTS
jgi:hypothetical protein